jgi:uridine monophosphate synthetase
MEEKLSNLADGLLSAGCVKFGNFTLKSGLESPIYLDLRRLVGFPDVLKEAAVAYAAILEHLEFDLLAALPYAALPIGTAVSLHGGWKMVYPRKEAKGYGTRVEVEGVFVANQRAVVLDDLISTGGSKLEGIQKLNAVGLQVSDIVVLIDRQSGGVDFIAEHGYRLHSVFTLPQLLDYWEENGAVDAEKIAATRLFLN